jgi:hypothetical protein
MPFCSASVPAGLPVKAEAGEAGSCAGPERQRHSPASMPRQKAMPHQRLPPLKNLHGNDT